MVNDDRVRLLRQTDVPFAPLLHLGAPGIETAFVISSAGGTALGGGFSHFIGEGLHDWNLHYDEVLFVIRGQLTIGFDKRAVVAEPGEAILIKRDTTVSFSGTPDTLVFVVLTPRDWEDTAERQAEIAKHRPQTQAGR